MFNAVAMWFELHLDEDISLSTSPYLDKGPTWQQAVQWCREVRMEVGDHLCLLARHDTYSISFELGGDGVVREGVTTDVPLKVGTLKCVNRGTGKESCCFSCPSCTNLRVRYTRLPMPRMKACAADARTKFYGINSATHTCTRMYACTHIFMQTRTHGLSSSLCAFAVTLQDPVWQEAFEGLQGLNSQLVKVCVQNPLEYRAVAEAAVLFAARPHDLGVDAQQAVDFCLKMMG